MLLKNVLCSNGTRKDIFCNNLTSDIDGSNFLALKAAIDSHVHFRSPGLSYKEDWITGSKAALSGGVIKVCDMPNTKPMTSNLELLEEKKNLILKELSQINSPLTFGLFILGSKKLIEELQNNKLPEYCVGIKLFLGESTGDSYMPKEEVESLFAFASKNGILIAIHAESQGILEKQKKLHKIVVNSSAELHSLLRPVEASLEAINFILDLVEKHRTRVHILHVTSQEELALIRKAKKNDLPVTAEAALPHLFFDLAAYQILGMRAKVNPPLRSMEDRKALWEALHEGIIDTIGSDHAPHLLSEKDVPLAQASSGMPGVEFFLPLLINEALKNKITFSQIETLTHDNVIKIFNFPNNDTLVLIDLKKKKKIKINTILSKCGWSPYEGRELTGWTKGFVIGNEMFDFENT